MTSQETHVSFSAEALTLFKKEVPYLTLQEYNELSSMVDDKWGEISLEQAESMLCVAKNSDWR